MRVPVHLAGPGGLFVDKVLRFVVRLPRVPGRVASDAGPGRHMCRAGAAIHTVLSGLITARTSGTHAPRVQNYGRIAFGFPEGCGGPG